MKHRTHKLAAKAVAAILCAALMLTACGSKETTSNETASTETTSATATEATSVESTEMTTTEAAVEPTEAPTETPAESPAPAVESTAAPVESTAVSTGYTYSELSQTMYAKSAVNIRDLPSTDGKKIGSLKASQEITVTGKCDQTGWYRFDGNNTTGYVSDKYIVSEKPAGNNTAATQQNTATPAPAQTTTTGSSEPYFDRAMAEQVFALVNNDRVANGLNALAWNEDMYNIAVQRCYEGVEGDIHGMMRSGTSENRVEGPLDDSNDTSTSGFCSCHFFKPSSCVGGVIDQPTLELEALVSSSAVLGAAASVFSCTGVLMVTELFAAVLSQVNTS